MSRPGSLRQLNPTLSSSRHLEMFLSSSKRRCSVKWDTLAATTGCSSSAPKIFTSWSCYEGLRENHSRIFESKSGKLGAHLLLRTGDASLDGNSGMMIRSSLQHHMTARCGAIASQYPYDLLGFCGSYRRMKVNYGWRSSQTRVASVFSKRAVTIISPL